MGIAIANRKNRCDFGALTLTTHTPLIKGVQLFHPLN